MSSQHKAGKFEGLALGIVGAGAVGSALARRLLELGVDLWIWSRRGIGGTDLEQNGAQEVRSLEELGQSVRVVLFAVSDGALEKVAREFAASLPELNGSEALGPNETGPVALHTAGALGPEALDVLNQRGWSRAQMHPLAAVRVGDPLPPGTYWGICGDERATDLAAGLVRALGDELLLLPKGQSLRYHLAANLVAGGAVALVDMALEAMQGVAKPDVARRALASLLATTAKNLDRAPTQEALTGPQVRGEVGLVRDHLLAMEELAPSLGAVYRLLARRMLTLTSEKGQDLGDKIAELERLLREP